MLKNNRKKLKSKLVKVEVNSGSDTDSEHELSYYMKDKVKLMKEVLKLIKPKKIQSMAPDCLKHLDVVEINSMLLEELLGISNKRLCYIFNGENVDRETSSSDSEDEKKPVDIISLDDISDNDIEDTLNPLDIGQNQHRKHKSPLKNEGSTSKKIPKLNAEVKKSEREKLMSVLELLELQARARAIKSQLALEARKKPLEEIVLKHEDDSDPDAVIIESPQRKEIVLTSSDSEEDIQMVTPQSSSPTIIIMDDAKEKTEEPNVSSKMLDLKKQKLLCKVKKIKLVRRKGLSSDSLSNIGEESTKKEPADAIEPLIKESIMNQDIAEVSSPQLSESLKYSNLNENPKTEITSGCTDLENDEIVINNLDEDEMKGIEND